ncbi:ribbon-helix-helix domain-containing protein [Salinarimonas ramus]|uniref:Transcriptional regulator n=1 Tax=Salinarimonas ramus TaxID=690164 RepID=A0A917QGS4_9HYPH|nr:type II toxin-antitoxin system ParD family antitoxin [Salinarimonas ramus]GGK49699.1 transcriptional regulator [Salinarimonas ramus]
MSDTADRIAIEVEPRVAEALDQLVRTGRFGSRDAILQEGLRLVQGREAKLAELDAAIARSLAEADAGLGIPADEVFADLKARYRDPAD